MSEVQSALESVTPPPAPAAPPPPAPAAPPPPPAPAAPPATPEWLGSLPQDLQANEDLQRMGSIEALAKGYVETRAWGKDRVALPTGDDDAKWKEFGEKLRPAKAEDYKIDAGEGSTELADAFRAFAYEEGMPARYAERAASFWNQQQANMVSKIKADNETDLKGLELQMGPAAYATRLEAVGNMFRSLGHEDYDAVAALEQSLGGEGKPGARAAMELLFSMAEKTGELAKVDSTGVELRLGNLTAAQAQAEINRMFADKDIAPTLTDPKSSNRAKYNQLLARVAKGD